MKIIVTGVNGQLGYDVIKILKDKKDVEIIEADKDNCDLTDEKATFEFVKSHKPDAVIHCGAYTAVDKAEDDKEICMKINKNGTEAIAKACKEVSAKMIYISTDYVFSGIGEKPWEINDEASPINYYGLSKYEGEKAVIANLKKFFIVRTSWVFGINGKNFVRTMINLGKKKNTILYVVNDQIGSPTYTPDLAKLLCDMIFTEKYGIYHGTNEEYCSWADFAEEIFKLTNLDVKVNRITTEEYKTKAIRPKNSRLSKKSLIEANFSLLPTWKDALKRYIKELKEHDEN